MEMFDWEVGVIERARAACQELSYQGNARRIGCQGLFEVIGEGEHFAAHSYDAVDEDWAAVEAAGWLDRVSGSPESRGQRPAGAGGL